MLKLRFTVQVTFWSAFPFGRVLLRVRMLYYLKAEVLGEAADKAFEGTPAKYVTLAFWSFAL